MICDQCHHTVCINGKMTQHFIQYVRILLYKLAPQNYLQVAVADPLVTFQRRSAGEVASPEIMSVVRIGEEIVVLQSPEI